MRPSSATVVCVVGECAPGLEQRLAGAANVTALSAGPELPGSPAEVATYVHAARALYERAGARQTPYALVSTDPLAPVREAWRQRFAQGVDTLEEFIGAMPAGVELPDYYLVAHRTAPSLELEWYGGLLRRLRPSRVVLLPGEDPEGLAAAAAQALGQLPTGPWWPPAQELWRAARTFVPAYRPPTPGDQRPQPPHSAACAPQNPLRRGRRAEALPSWGLGRCW